MNSTYIKNYFENDFQKDILTFNGFKYKSSEEMFMCKMTFSGIFGNERNKKDYIDVKLFVIFLYELNLISQLVYGNLKEKSQSFQELLPLFPQSRGCFSHPLGPLDIISEFNYLAKKNKINIKIDENDILNVDIFFKNFLINLLVNNPSIGISWEDIEKAFLNDKDINNYLNNPRHKFSLVDGFNRKF
jgi:hypothetical protein